jgi:hypothetical protein
MIDQFTFDKAEEICDALHEQDGLHTALFGYLGNKLSDEQERVVFSLLNAQKHCRNRAAAAATAIIKGGTA